jgi:hypothetical protein
MCAPLGDAAVSLLLVVRLSSERAIQAVRQDCSFAKNQASPPALLVVVAREPLDSHGEMLACLETRNWL